MQTHQFAVSAKEGADNYLNYLEETGRGHEEIKVNRIEREDTVYLLYLSKNPFSTETVHIVIGTQEYTQKEIEVIEQDRDKRIIYVKPSKELPDPFYQRYVRDVRVVSDLKFLYSAYTTGIKIMTLIWHSITIILKQYLNIFTSRICLQDS